MTGPTTWLSNTAGAVPHSFIKVKLVANQVVEEYSVSHYPVVCHSISLMNSQLRKLDVPPARTSAFNALTNFHETHKLYAQSIVRAFLPNVIGILNNCFTRSL